MPDSERIVFECRFCLRQFSVTSGTVLQDTHLPLFKWLQAVALWLEYGEELKGTDLEKGLGVSYRTAWFLRHKLKHVLETPDK
jgi:transposase-like protein